MGLQESAIHNEGTFAANVLKEHLRQGAYDCRACQARHFPPMAVNRWLGEPMIYKKAVEVMKFHLWYAALTALCRRLGQAHAVLPEARLSRHRPRPVAPLNSESDPDTRATAEKQGKSLDEIADVTLRRLRRKVRRPL